MSTIDLGDNPVGSTPTDAQKTQLRSSIGLGNTDSVEFGAIIPPSGTTSEIDAVNNASVGQVMIDTDRNRHVRFTGPSTYQTIGYISAKTYYVDPQNGDDTTGSVGGLPFATIKSAMTKAVSDGTSPILVECMAGTYSEEDALDGITTNEEVSINFAIGSKYNNTSMSAPLFESASIPNLIYIGGDLTWIEGDFGFFSGLVSSNGARLEINSLINYTTSAPLFNIVSGVCDINIKGKVAGKPQPIIKIDGNPVVTCNKLDAEYETEGGFFPVIKGAILLNAGTLNISNTRLINAGVCEITNTSTDRRRVVMHSCVSNYFAVKAASVTASTSVFTLGFNAFGESSTNVTIDETFGSSVVNSSASDILGL